MPTGWLAHSTRNTSSTPCLAPPRWPMDHVSPAPRTTRAHRHRADNPLPLHSTPSTPDAARPRPATADDPPPYPRRPRPPSPPTDAANGPSTAPASHARTTPWNRSDCPRSRPHSLPRTTTGRIARSSASCPAHWPRVRQDPDHPAACSATRTSPGTAVHAPDCVAAAPVPPPARTGCPDVPALAAHVLSQTPTVAPASVNPTPPPATPACSRRTRSTLRFPTSHDWPPGYRLPHRPDPKDATAAAPNSPRASYTASAHAAG